MLVYHPYDNKNCLMAEQMSFIFYVGATEENKTAPQTVWSIQGASVFRKALVYTPQTVRTGWNAIPWLQILCPKAVSPPEVSVEHRSWIPTLPGCKNCQLYKEDTSVNSAILLIWRALNPWLPRIKASKDGTWEAKLASSTQMTTYFL